MASLPCAAPRHPDAAVQATVQLGKIGVRGVEDALHQKMALSQRLSLLDALNSALDRRSDVLHVIEESQDAAEAHQAVRSLLGVDDIGARAVLALPLHRLTRSERARIAEERLEVERHLDEMR